MRYQEVEWRSLATSSSIGGATADSKLASDDPGVLPLLSRDHLEDALQRLPAQAMGQALRARVVPVAWHPGHVQYATCGSRGADHAMHHGLSVIARIAPVDFHTCVRRVWGRKILAHATYGLFASHPQLSARRRVTLCQMIAFLLLAACPGISLAFFPPSTVWTGASAVLGLFFLSVVALRLFCLFPLPPSGKRNAADLNDTELPVYSVLVPVLRETSVLKQLLRALLHLNYPAGKLDIKIIVEETDTTMRRALWKYDLPPHFEVIMVPQGSPQTKPRALNYALQFCRGSLLTIYDAEDVPEPNQLREVAREFSCADEKLACVQAQLSFYNPNENWLTRGIMAQTPQEKKSLAA